MREEGFLVDANRQYFEAVSDSAVDIVVPAWR